MPSVTASGIPHRGADAPVATALIAVPLIARPLGGESVIGFVLMTAGGFIMFLSDKFRLKADRFRGERSFVNPTPNRSILIYVAIQPDEPRHRGCDVRFCGA